MYSIGFNISKNKLRNFLLKVIIMNNIIDNNCPFCKSHLYKSVDTIHTSDLLTLYKDNLAINIASFIKNDSYISLLQCNECDLKWFSPSTPGDSNFYEELQKNDWYYQDEKPEYRYAAKFIKPSAKVLEIGCGKGAFRNHLPEAVNFYGLEFNDEAIKKALSTGLNVKKESIEDHSISQSKAYDVVCSFQVLEHTKSPREFLSAAAQSLRPEGLMIIAVPSEDSFLSLVNGGLLNMPPHHLSRWTDKALLNAYDALGLTTLDIWHEPVADYHRDWYQTVIAKLFLTRALGIAPGKLYDKSVIHRIINRICRYKTLRSLFLNIQEQSFEFHSRGHTVCIVGRKS